MELFWPERVVVEPDALGYPLGRAIHDRLQRAGLPIEQLPAAGRSKLLAPATTPRGYQAAKRVLVLAVQRKLAFEGCKPSADFYLPLAGGCPGACQYCYLAATYEMKPFVRLHVNLDELLAEAADKVRIRAPQLTSFEGSSTADILALEHLSGSVAQCVQFFAQLEHGRFRVVTKFNTIEGLLNLDHHGHTKIRFSLNAPEIIRLYEQHTASLTERLSAARRVADAGYPLGVILAPLMLHDGWREGYRETLSSLAEALGPHASAPITFELIQHRFTPKAKRVILAAYPATKLPLNEAERQLKPGRYPGAQKFVYPKAAAQEMEGFLREEIAARFSAASVEYFT